MCLIEGSRDRCPYPVGRSDGPKARPSSSPTGRTRGAPLSIPRCRRTACSSSPRQVGVRCRQACSRLLLEPRQLHRAARRCRQSGLERKQAEAAGSRSPGFGWRRKCCSTTTRGQGRYRRHGPLTREGEQARLRAGHGTAREAHTLFAEGCRGHWQAASSRPASNCARTPPVTYGPGIKEQGSPRRKPQAGPGEHRRLADGQRDVRGGLSITSKASWCRSAVVGLN